MKESWEEEGRKRRKRKDREEGRGKEGFRGGSGGPLHLSAFCGAVSWPEGVCVRRRWWLHAGEGVADGHGWQRER